MAAFSEVSNAQLKRLDALVNQYAYLDDSLVTLQADLGRLKKVIAEYGLKLEDLLNGFIDPQIFAGITADAQRAFIKSLESYIESGKLQYRQLTADNLLQSFNATWATQVSRLVSTTTDNLFQRAASFKSLSQAAEIPLRRIEDIKNYEITSVQISGKQYNYQQLDSIWKQMNDSYGQRDTIQFRNGVNYPIRSYIDARSATTQAEAHRMVTIAEGSANGVYFGKTDNRGSTDSCALHEGETFFLSDGARDEALAKWPDIDSLKSMRTWEEIKSDGTHMGRFGCNHIVKPLSIQFYSDERFRKALDNNQVQEIPEKINERKIFEDITGRKFIAPTPKDNSSYQPIPPRKDINPRYTIV